MSDPHQGSSVPPVPPVDGSVPAGGSAPSYGAAPTSDTTPGYGAPPTYSPGADGSASGPSPYGTTKPPRGLSLASFITGIGSVLFALFPLLGILAGVAAVVLGFIGRRKERGAPKWMWLTGIITGFVGIVVSILALIASILLYTLAGTDLQY